MKCSCARRKIHCSRTVEFVSFLRLSESLPTDQKFIEHCNQTNCNVASFVKENKGICYACRWNGKLYYDGDHWKENGIDFYCSSSGQKVRPGCYVENRRISCTGAIPGLQDLSLISRHALFLCDSGDEIRSLSDRCNIKPAECADRSDEKDCNKYFCPYEIAHGFLWNRTQEDKEVIRQCSLINSSWIGEFGSKCSRNYETTVWVHNTTCNCEKRSIVEYFKGKVSLIADVNGTSLMNVSGELVRSAQENEFFNPKSFQDLFEELFDIATTQLLIPLTQQNADAALQYCRHVINTVLSSPPYAVKTSSFCKPALATDRNSLAKKSLEFLRKAPSNTAAFNYSLVKQLTYVADPIRIEPHKENFRPSLVFFASITRRELILQLNTAPLLPAAVSVTPTPEIINNENNVTIKNNHYEPQRSGS
ncbi:uncharacterized protein [Porites lutea]|uniref:uncharacterized protein n=1 Tax=Porites lutea TaxID=51062 RepID=UPI003CC666AE